MNLPKTIKVGPFVFGVSHNDEECRNRDAVGVTLKAKHEISVLSGQAPRGMQETLLHEVLHACWGLTPLETSSSELEEQVVSALSPYLFGVLRDNPSLVKYLIQ